jgi:hypothetical protein
VTDMNISSSHLSPPTLCPPPIYLFPHLASPALSIPFASLIPASLIFSALFSPHLSSKGHGVWRVRHTVRPFVPSRGPARWCADATYTSYPRSAPPDSWSPHSHPPQTHPSTPEPVVHSQQAGRLPEASDNERRMQIGRLLLEPGAYYSRVVLRADQHNRRRRRLRSGTGWSGRCSHNRKPLRFRPGPPTVQALENPRGCEPALGLAKARNRQDAEVQACVKRYDPPSPPPVQAWNPSPRGSSLLPYHLPSPAYRHGRSSASWQRRVPRRGGGSSRRGSSSRGALAGRDQGVCASRSLQHHRSSSGGGR